MSIISIVMFVPKLTTFQALINLLTTILSIKSVISLCTCSWLLELTRYTALTTSNYLFTAAGEKQLPCSISEQEIGLRLDSIDDSRVHLKQVWRIHL